MPQRAVIPAQPLAPMAADPALETGGPDLDAERAPPGAVLFEFAWEVCNQVGGIYQVLRSKAPTMVGRWHNRYYLVGPYEESKASLEFEPRTPTGWMAQVLNELAAQGVPAYFGRWLITGSPKVILLDHRMSRDALNAVKYRLWDHHKISSPDADPLIDGVVSFSDAALKLCRAVCRHWRTRKGGKGEGSKGGKVKAPKADRRVVGHFHEWMGGLALPEVRHERLPMSTVFTTHATMLGRSIAWNDEWFYDHLPSIDHAAEAAKYNIVTQHSVERACAHGAHVMTTVSQITGEECAQLLGRRQDMVLPNGINVDRYNVGHDFQTFHAQFKERIHRFTMGHFFPSYAFDLEKTLYFFTSGRYEPRNKGFDLCLEAMARLNAELKAAKLGVTVILFIVTHRPTRSLHPQAMHSRGVLRELREVCERIVNDTGERLFRRAASGDRIRIDDLIDDYWRLRLRRTQFALRTDRQPLVCTHLLEDEANDIILNQARGLWLNNGKDDPVKIVYHPEFINPVNPLWGIEYEQFVRGCHMGIFPSAYEPWGYTPLECVAMGVPAVTSDLAGFGRYVSEAYPDHDRWGLKVLRRRSRTFSDSAADLTRYLLEFCRLDRRGRITLRNQVERHSWEFDWSKLGRAYDWAHDLAMARAGAGEG